MASGPRTLLYGCHHFISRASSFSQTETPFPVNTNSQHPSLALVQSLSPVQLCKLMDRSPPGLPVHHHLLEFTQTHVRRVSDAIQPPHPLSTPSPPAFNLSRHRGLFQWVRSSHQAAKVLELQLQHQSFQSAFRVDFLWDRLSAGNVCSALCL